MSSDGKNFSLELARIPNKESIYKQIYTDYGYNGAVDSTYKGSTCNVYSCGSNITLGGKTYQGSNATHSSISIGSVYGVDGNKNLKAYDGADAIGIVFGTISNGGPVTTTATVEGYRYLQRALGTTTWSQTYRCTSILNSSCSTTVTGNLTQWNYTGAQSGQSNLVSTPGNATCSNTWGACTGNSGTTPMYGNEANRNWSIANLNGATWQAGLNAGAAGLVGIGTQSGMSSTNQSLNPVSTSGSFTNLGSAVIDGMLIQHMKITTKGL